VVAAAEPGSPHVDAPAVRRPPDNRVSNLSFRPPTQEVGPAHPRTPSPPEARGKRRRLTPHRRGRAATNLDSTNGRALLLRYLSLAGPQRTAPSQRGVGLARSTTHPLVLGCARARDPLRPSVGWRRSGEAAPSRGCGCPSLAEPGDDSARQQPLVVRPPGWGSTSRPHVGPLAARWVTVGGPAPMEPPTEFERGAPRAGPRGRARGRSATPSSGPPGESGLHMWVSGPKPHLRGGATSGQSMHCTHPAARHGPPFRGPGGAAHLRSLLHPS
jgi:hypothetical protein